MHARDPKVHKCDFIRAAGILPLMRHPETREIIVMLGQERYGGNWCDFGGKLNHEELTNQAALRAACRELFEETCTGINQFIENTTIDHVESMQRRLFVYCKNHVLTHYTSWHGKISPYRMYVVQFPYFENGAMPKRFPPEMFTSTHKMKKYYLEKSDFCWVPLRCLVRALHKDKICSCHSRVIRHLLPEFADMLRDCVVDMEAKIVRF
jgi:8-oxo-dGTP pyrophosphatase MutT (NUDIX family)